jgi:hypothetical protein
MCGVVEQEAVRAVNTGNTGGGRQCRWMFLGTSCMSSSSPGSIAQLEHTWQAQVKTLHDGRQPAIAVCRVQVQQPQICRPGDEVAGELLRGARCCRALQACMFRRSEQAHVV